MRQIIYSMRFNGHAAPSGASANVLKAMTAAPSCSITTVVGPDGLSGSIEPAAGADARIDEAEGRMVMEHSRHRLQEGRPEHVVIVEHDDGVAMSMLEDAVENHWDSQVAVAPEKYDAGIFERTHDV